jgi:hypothetical protein
LAFSSIMRSCTSQLPNCRPLNSRPTSCAINYELSSPFPPPITLSSIAMASISPLRPQLLRAAARTVGGANPAPQTSRSSSRLWNASRSYSTSKENEGGPGDFKGQVLQSAHQRVLKEKTDRERLVRLRQASAHESKGTQIWTIVVSMEFPKARLFC